VAGPYQWVDQVRQVQALAVTAGHEISFDWTGDEGEIRSNWESATSAAREIGNIEKEAVLTSDAVILVGNGDDHGKGLGCFIEVGMALAADIDVFIIGGCRDSVFWYQPNVVRVRTAEEAVAALTDGTGHGDIEAGALLMRARGEIHRLRRVAWDCAQAAGADLSGCDGPHHLVFEPGEAVEAVRELRSEYDETGGTTP
jgi:hypothetical protein